MAIAAIHDPIVTMSGSARPEPARSIPARLWGELADAWLRHQERRVGLIVRAQQHDGVLEHFHAASRADR